jgi:hypothetical protein
MIWKCYIPRPRAKRLVKRQVTIACSDGWSGDDIQVVEIAADQTEFQFQLPDEYEWIQRANHMDGPTFSIIVESFNNTGSRKETQELVPLAQ